MTNTSTRFAANAERTPSRLNRWRVHWRSLSILTPLLVLAALWQYIGMDNAPQRIDDEGTYVAQAYAVQTFHSLGHYTYWYDHPPLGWIQLAAYTWTTDAFGREPNAVLAGREAMLFFQLVSCVLLWVLCRRLLLARWSSGVAVVLFSLSPLAVQFHRTVYLDNIATPWILAAFILALSPQRRLWAYAASGLAFAFAVLTKETSLLLLPALIYALWRNSGSGGTRRYAFSLAASAFVLASGFYVLYAVIKGELMPGADHVSLWNGVKFQLFTRQGSGSVFTSGTLSYAHLHQWLQLDSVFPLASVLCLVPAFLVSRLRPFAVGYTILLVTMLRPGYLPVPFVIAMLPFAALTIAGVADAASTWVPASWKTRAQTKAQSTSRSQRRIAPLLPVVLVGAIAAAAVAVPNWVSQQRGLFIGPLDQPVAQAESWIEQNIPHNARMAVDDAFWVDLVRSGFPRQNVVWYYKVDTDPAVEKLSPNGWKDYSYVISTQSLRGDPEAAPEVNDALVNSVPYAVFGTGINRVEVRRVISAGLKGVAAQQAVAAAARSTATAGLAANPALAESTAARSVLQRGQLDLRASISLLSLANSAGTAAKPLHVIALPADPAETAAGMPVRAVELSGLSPTQVKQDLSGLPSLYQPRVTALGSTGVRLTWPVGDETLVPAT
jgi:4-amino-4-deoxy-L-arabinose transferase-like glycosyltransferase